VAITPVGSNKVSMDSEAVVFWNVHGLNTRGHRDVVTELVYQERVSLICLQETKLHECNDALINSILGSSFIYSFLPVDVTWGGILVPWRSAVWTASHLRISANTSTLKVRSASHRGVLVAHDGVWSTGGS
jgi:hypothetical protein